LTYVPICEFAYLLKCTGDPKVNAQGLSMVIQGHAKSSENLSHPAQFPTSAGTGDALLFCLYL